MPQPLPTTIQEVIHRLDEIIEETIKENNRLGIFAYVYRRTTAQIQLAISRKRFEDNERMEIFDVLFANRYIAAYDDFKLKKDISNSWLAAFEEKSNRLTVIQHLMMGMNAHISFDLGMAAQAIAPLGKIDELKNDFFLINQILQEIIEEMQDRIGRVSRLMFLLDWVGARDDEEIINFGIVSARNFAWKFAQGLLILDGKSKKVLVHETDLTVAALNKIIRKPKTRTLRFVLRVISFFETRSVKKIISKLRID